MSDASHGVEFGSLPARTRVGGGGGGRRSPSKEWVDIAKQLQDRPGEWAKVVHPKVQNQRQASGVASRIKNGKSAAFTPAGSYAAKVINGELWAQFTGGLDLDEDSTSGEFAAPVEQTAPDTAEDVEVEELDDDAEDTEDAEQETIVRF